MQHPFKVKNVGAVPTRGTQNIHQIIMSKQEEQKEAIDNLVYEIRTQTGLIVLLMLLNLCTVGFCFAGIWYLMHKTLP